MRTMTNHTDTTRLDWMKTGSIFASDDKEKAEFLSKCDLVEWFSLPNEEPLPFSQGYAIREMVKQFFSGKADAAGWVNAFARFSLIAVKGNFSNGVVELFAVDTGCELMPVLVKFYEKQ